jgi:hypothetical protein
VLETENFETTNTSNEDERVPRHHNKNHSIVERVSLSTEKK